MHDERVEPALAAIVCIIVNAHVQWLGRLLSFVYDLEVNFPALQLRSLFLLRLTLFIVRITLLAAAIQEFFEASLFTLVQSFTSWHDQITLRYDTPAHATPEHVLLFLAIVELGLSLDRRHLSDALIQLPLDHVGIFIIADPHELVHRL